MSLAKQGMLYVLIASILWGSSGVCAQYLMEHLHISAGWLTMSRLLFSGIILLMLGFLQGQRVFSVFGEKKEAIKLFIFSLCGTLTVQFTFLVTIEKSNAATGTILQFLSPTVIVTWFALTRKKLPGVFVCAAILTSLAGTFLLVTHGNPTSLSISPAALIWGIASAFAAAFYSTYSSGLISRHGTLLVVGWSMFIAGVSMMPFFLLPEENIAVNGLGLFAFFYLIIVGTAVTFSLYFKGASLIGGQKASILSCAEPLTSAVLSLLLLGITFTLPDWLGTLLILSSVLLIAMDAKGKLHR